VLPLKAGGVWGALIGAALESGSGFELELEEETLVSDLLAETLGAIVVSTQPLEGLRYLGTTTTNLEAVIKTEAQNHVVNFSEIIEAWQNQLRKVF